MFGEAYDYIVEKSKTAFARVQMSQNDYLRQVNGFATGLKFALGGNAQAAAELADKIVVAEADVVAATGQTQEAVQNAFNGIMKSNYTMLDNLLIGITPTKQGYQEMIDKVNAWNAANGKATKYHMGNLAQEQAALVDYIEMVGMKGYAEKEAAGTIQGSLAMTKAAWQDLLVTISNGGDIGLAVDNLVYAIDKFTSNITPIIERTLIGLGQAAQKILPSLVQTVVSALVQQIPNLVAAVYNMIIGLFKGIVLGIKALFTGGTAKATNTIQNSISGIAESAGTATSNINDISDATNKAGKEAKKAGKEAKKTLAAFDEISILASGSGSDSDSGSGSSGSGSSIPNVSTPSISAGGGGGGLLNPITQEIDAQLTAIMAIAGASLIAIGILLLFLGNIPMGIGFIIVGAITFGVAAQNSKKTGYATEIIDMLTAIMGIAGGALLALGIILLYIGGVIGKGYAIGMIVAGAALIVSAVATKIAFSKNDIKSWLSLITGVAGGALLALGVILLMVGSIPLGIGMVISGSASLATAVALNWNETTNKVTDFLKVNAGLIVGISLALLALGIILCCCGVITPLSIGLIVAGSVGLATEITLNWNAMVDSIKSFLKDNSGLIVGISLALLVLGIILCCVGVITPLSIGLIVAGAVGLATEIALNWGNVWNNISKFLTDNSGLIVGISLALLVLGIILCCVGVITPLSIGLIVVGATGLATEIALNWSYITQSISDFIKNNSGLIVGIAVALVVLGIILLFTGVAIPLAIGLIVAGGAILATETVLNWNYITQSITEFIKNNSGLIVGVSLALVVLGIILLFTGVGIPLAIGLIVAGGGALAATVAFNWNFIVDKVKEVWKNVKDFWNKNIAPVFTWQWWSNLGKNAINGLIASVEKGLNFIINKINTLSWNVPDWVPGIGGKKWGFNFRNIQIPRLAQGAVIPPNREFLAVLGDQKQGTNIEAPAELIKEMVIEAMSEMGASNQTTKEEHYYLNETELMTILYKLVQGGKRIAGNNFVSEGSY
jgi:hypothetical protein